MPRNALTIIKEFNRDFFSQNYKTEVYDSSTASFRLLYTRYRLTVYVGEGVLRFDYVSNEEMQIHVQIPDKGNYDEFAARYLNFDNESITYVFNKIKEILVETAYDGDDIEIILTKFRRSVPRW